MMVNELVPLTVTNTAAEANIHATLGYTLVNPPRGAVIDTNGIIMWTPLSSQSPGTNVITTVVTSFDALDIMNPQLSATNSFTVIVRPPLVISTPVWPRNGQFQFSFDSASGTSYTVQSSTDLINWSFVAELNGNGGVVTFVDPNAGGSHKRFYRVKVGGP
jgi:hypothetical protein